MITVSLDDLAGDVVKYLEAVERGETLEVRKNGKPVAIVSPPSGSHQDYWKSVKPLPIQLKGASLTETLLAEREESPRRPPCRVGTGMQPRPVPLNGPASM
jgi:antitoxin (DNA-binding transcriptional repressor) of toxin-antitoxin stability system